MRPSVTAPAAARSGREALRLPAERPIAVALTDIMMPEMDGIELLRAIRALGAHAVLTKPFAFATLIAALRRAIAPGPI